MKRALFTLCICLLPQLVAAQIAPTEYIRQNVDAVISLVTAPQYQSAESKSELRKRLEDMTDSFFDGQELSKRAVAQHWKLFSPPQRQEFQTLFLQLIKNVYLKRIMEYTNEVVVYGQEIRKSDTLAEVHTTVTSDKLNVPIIYFMISHGESWKVYDVSVENISLAKNYRSQFQSILQKDSPETLLTILRDKTHEPHE